MSAAPGQQPMGPADIERIRKFATIGVGLLLALVMGAVMLVGSRLATRVTVDVRALETASALAAYPSMLDEQLSSLRDRLEERSYAAQALANLHATAVSFDRDLRRLARERLGRSADLGQARELWRAYAPVLGPVVSFKGEPYIDTDSGTILSAAGRAHYASVKRAQLFAREHSPRLHAVLDSLATALEAGAAADARELRLLLLGGALAAVLLALIAAYLQVARARNERAAREAQEQTADILRTVREGFFLLDSDYRIGSVWSHALTRLFGRESFAGLPFEELLKDLVPAATLATATKYIKLLWGERAHESLMKSINPLGQLEIRVDNGHGGHDVRYLQFDFHRVAGRHGVKHVLVSVTDITASVQLARELQESQQNANAHVDMMMGVLSIDPDQLGTFLDTAGASLALVNAILKEPARADAEFRKKLDGLQRALHPAIGEVAGVDLASVSQRVGGIGRAGPDGERHQLRPGRHCCHLVPEEHHHRRHLPFGLLRGSGPAAAPGHFGLVDRELHGHLLGVDPAQPVHRARLRGGLDGGHRHPDRRTETVSLRNDEKLQIVKTGRR